MTFKKILTPIQHEDSAEAALRAAVALARRFKAHVEALHIRQVPSLPAGGYYPVGVVYVDDHINELNAALDEQAARMKKLFDRVMREEAVPVIAAASHRDDSGATASWREERGVLPYDMSAAARVADIVCFGRAKPEQVVTETELLEEAIFQSGRPVIIVPEGKLTAPPRRIAVGWNGGREASRALAAATPLLAEAEDAAVISIDPLPAGSQGPEAAAALLRLHGVRAEAVRIERVKGEDADETFTAKARGWRADFIVAGAYSHSRWRELVLGGFTRSLIKQSEFPLLLAH